MKGIFLGAGASYEVGMPLVWEFSSTLRKNVLSRLDTNLFNFKGNEKLKRQFIDLLSDENRHYEEVVGELESIYLSRMYETQDVWGVIIQLIECIQLLLLEEQENTIELLKLKSLDYYGIVSFIKKCGYVDVYSLNHDVVFEELCNLYQISYKDGFFEEYTKYDHITNFGQLTKSQIDSKKFNLFNDGGIGVNIIKLHGSIDTFAVEDKDAYLKTRGRIGVAGSCVSSVRALEDLGMKFMTENGTRAVNELLVNDNKGEIQMLRRSLLSGANKFKGKLEQIIPESFLEIFRTRLERINTLYVIGYSFGDSHINDILNDWMKDCNREVIIYDPYRTSVPDVLSQHSKKVVLSKGGFSDFCLSQDCSLESEKSKSIRKTLTEKRENLRVRRIET